MPSHYPKKVGIACGIIVNFFLASAGYCNNLGNQLRPLNTDSSQVVDYKTIVSTEKYSDENVNITFELCTNIDLGVEKRKQVSNLKVLIVNKSVGKIVYLNKTYYLRAADNFENSYLLSSGQYGSSSVYPGEQKTLEFKLLSKVVAAAEFLQLDFYKNDLGNRESFQIKFKLKEIEKTPALDEEQLDAPPKVVNMDLLSTGSSNKHLSRKTKNRNNGATLQKGASRAAKSVWNFLNATNTGYYYPGASSYQSDYLEDEVYRLNSKYNRLQSEVSDLQSLPPTNYMSAPSLHQYTTPGIDYSYPAWNGTPAQKMQFYGHY